MKDVVALVKLKRIREYGRESVIVHNYGGETARFKKGMGEGKHRDVHKKEFLKTCVRVSSSMCFMCVCVCVCVHMRVYAHVSVCI